jgi:hypothetical protein
VFINRPLNAYNNDGGFRLASYPKTNYEEVKHSTISNLETLKHEGESVLDLVKQMDNILPRIKSVFEWDNYRMSGIYIYYLRKF